MAEVRLDFLGHSHKHSHTQTQIHPHSHPKTFHSDFIPKKFAAASNKHEPAKIVKSYPKASFSYLTAIHLYTLFNAEKTLYSVDKRCRPRYSHRQPNNLFHSLLAKQISVEIIFLARRLQINVCNRLLE